MNNTTYDLITVGGAFRVFIHAHIYKNEEYMNILKELLKEEFNFEDSNIKVNTDRMDIVLSKKRKSSVIDNPFYSVNSTMYKFFTRPEIYSGIRNCIMQSSLEDYKKGNFYNYLARIMEGDTTSISLLYSISIPSMSTVNLIL